MQERGERFDPDIVDAFPGPAEEFRRIRQEMFEDQEDAQQAGYGA